MFLLTQHAEHAIMVRWLNFPIFKKKESVKSTEAQETLNASEIRHLAAKNRAARAMKSINTIIESVDVAIHEKVKLGHTNGSVTIYETDKGHTVSWGKECNVMYVGYDNETFTLVTDTCHLHYRSRGYTVETDDQIDEKYQVTTISW